MQFISLITKIAQDTANQFYNHPKMNFPCKKKNAKYTKSEAYLRSIFESFNFNFNSGKYPDYDKVMKYLDNEEIERMVMLRCEIKEIKFKKSKRKSKEEKQGDTYECNSQAPYLEAGSEEFFILNKYADEFVDGKKQPIMKSLVIIPLQYINTHTMEMIPHCEITCPNCNERFQKHNESRKNLGSNGDVGNRDRLMWNIISPFDRYPMLEEKCSLILPESIEVPFVASEEKILRSDGWYKVYHLSANN